MSGIEREECYLFGGECYCLDCGELLRVQMVAAGLAPADLDDLRSYSHDDFPHGPHEVAETDSPWHCKAGPDCLNGIPELRAGKLLTVDLTDAGERYILEALAEGGAVAEFWAREFRDHETIGKHLETSHNG